MCLCNLEPYTIIAKANGIVSFQLSCHLWPFVPPITPSSSGASLFYDCVREDVKETLQESSNMGLLEAFNGRVLN